MQIERLKTKQETQVEPKNLKAGEIYECVADPYGFYAGWILFVIDYSPEKEHLIYGAWLNEPAAIFSTNTSRSEDFRFKKLNMKLVEVKE
jgi:hypothetical protein